MLRLEFGILDFGIVCNLGFVIWNFLVLHTRKRTVHARFHYASALARLGKLYASTRWLILQ